MVALQAAPEQVCQELGLAAQRPVIQDRRVFHEVAHEYVAYPGVENPEAVDELGAKSSPGSRAGRYERCPPPDAPIKWESTTAPKNPPARTRLFSPERRDKV